MTATRRRAERAGLWLAVAGAHALLLLALGSAVLPRLRETAPPVQDAPLRVRLIDASPTAAAPPPAQPTAPALRARAAPLERPPIVVPQAISAAPVAAEVPPAAIPAPAPAPTAPNTNAALEWRPPRSADAASAPRSMRDQMLNDPRTNSPKPRVETRIAAVAGSTEWTEEAMDATRRRMQKNGRCIEVHIARNAQIDPWNQSAQPTPKAVKPSCD
jgi:hypothetical protein